MHECFEGCVHVNGSFEDVVMKSKRRFTFWTYRRIDVSESCISLVSCDACYCEKKIHKNVDMATHGRCVGLIFTRWRVRSLSNVATNCRL